VKFVERGRSAATVSIAPRADDGADLSSAAAPAAVRSRRQRGDRRDQLVVQAIRPASAVRQVSERPVAARAVA
jgi:hypothetical protein